MRYTIGVLAVCLLAGCSGSPPKPPQPEGPYRPVNKPAALLTQAKTDIFDFAYEGDILGALPALKESAPHITVMPALGTALPLPVRILLRGATLEDALRAIGEQGGNAADVVWTATRHQGVNQVFIRFRTPAAVPAPGTNQRGTE